MQSVINCEKISKFVDEYVPKLGTTVCDGVFDVVASSKKGENGLTTVKLATEVIQRFFYVPIKDAMRTNNDRLLLVLLEYLFKVVTDKIGLTVGKEWFKGAILPYSYGNNKLGAGILTFNVSPAFLCPSMCTGQCKGCSDCYAMFSERRHGSELARNILAFIRILKYPIETIVNDTIKALGRKKKTLASQFIRFSQNGDILNNSVLIKVNKLAMALLERYDNLLGAYTYTHNNNLDLSLASHIVVNQSEKDLNAVKSTIVLYKWENKYFDPSKYILCLGDCSLCPYCKNGDDTRTVIFMAHGGGLNAIETVPEPVIQFYDWLRGFNNQAFINQMELAKMTA